MSYIAFHFTLKGVPRMREIVNAVANIRTPLLSVTITDPTSASLARRVKLLIEPTRLADIALRLRQCLSPDEVCVRVELDVKRMARREITAVQVANAVRNASWSTRRLKLSRVTFSDDHLTIYPADMNRLELLVQMLEVVVVKGIPGVSRVVIQEDKDGKHNIFVEGAKLREVRHFAQGGVFKHLLLSSHCVNCYEGNVRARGGARGDAEQQYPRGGTLSGRGGSPSRSHGRTHCGYAGTRR